MPNSVGGSEETPNNSERYLYSTSQTRGINTTLKKAYGLVSATRLWTFSPRSGYLQALRLSLAASLTVWPYFPFLSFYMMYVAGHFPLSSAKLGF